MFFHNLKIEGEGNVNYKKIAGAVYKELKQKAKLKAEVVLVNEEEIKKLNAENRNVDKVTDVLSFPTLDGIRNKILDPKDYPYELDGDRLFIGSVALCLEQAKRQADELGHATEREYVYLVIHGLLHLFGFDHMTDEDKKEMRSHEKSILKRLKIEEEE